MGSNPSFACRSDFRCLELALIQEWQPRLNYPFICQFFHPKKGLLKHPAMNTHAQFGLATLWRRARHRFTPKVIKDILASDRFQHRLQLWHIIHDLGSNTKARFETTKMLRSNEGGLPLCYALRQLAANIQEPYRTLALQAIDNTTSFGGRANRPHMHQHFVHPGPSVPIWPSLFKAFYTDGTSACWNIMFLAMSHPSRQSSSSTLPWLTYCA